MLGLPSSQNNCLPASSSQSEQDGTKIEPLFTEEEDQKLLKLVKSYRDELGYETEGLFVSLQKHFDNRSRAQLYLRYNQLAVRSSPSKDLPTEGNDEVEGRWKTADELAREVLGQVFLEDRSFRESLIEAPKSPSSANRLQPLEIIKTASNSSEDDDSFVEDTATTIITEEAVSQESTATSEDSESFFEDTDEELYEQAKKVKLNFQTIFKASSDITTERENTDYVPVIAGEMSSERELPFKKVKKVERGQDGLETPKARAVARKVSSSSPRKNLPDCELPTVELPSISPIIQSLEHFLEEKQEEEKGDKVNNITKEDVERARGIVSWLEQKTGCHCDVVIHALYIYSGNLRDALFFLLTKEGSKRWTIQEDLALLDGQSLKRNGAEERQAFLVAACDLPVIGS